MFSEVNSNDVVDLNSDDDDDIIESVDSDKPIIQLFKRLITSDNKQHTILTNAQIVDILHKEFDIIISKIHELEGDIYLTIMKKYLKDWPQWDEFDKTVNELKKKNDLDSSLNKVLQTNYINLRQYLKYILDYTGDLAKKAVQKTVDEEVSKKQDNSEENNGRTVVLEVRASRNQLNQLFFRVPKPELHNSIFNSTYSVPTQISCNTLPLEAILNWWGVCVGIATTNNVWIYKRETIHELQHVLVNRNLISRFDPLKVLDQDLKINNGIPLTKIDKSDYVTFIDNMASQYSNAKYIFEFIKKDLELLPNMLYSRVSYKRYTNKYPYVRYLYKDTESQDKDENNTSDKRFDIQLKETVSPQYRTYIGKIVGLNKNLVVKCLPCSYTPSVTNLIEDLRSHYYEHHSLEPDWKCTNCSKSFSMAYLAQNWWTHRC